MNSINHKIVDILTDKGLNTLTYTEDDKGVEYTFDTESEVLDLFNQLDVKGKTITFSTPMVYEHSLDGVTIFITKFELS